MLSLRNWLAPALLAGLGAAPVWLGCAHPICRAMAILALLVLVFWVAWHRSQVHKLRQWFASPDNVLPPPASGQWEEVFSLGYRWRKGEEQQRQHLNEALSQFREAIDILPDALLLLDPVGQILWANRACARLLGLRWPADRGQPLSYLVRNPRFLAFFEAGAPGTIHLPAPALPERTLEGNRYVLPNGHSLMVFRDISRLLQLEQVRRDFVANVSHELRSPLTVVSGFIETLQDTPGCDNDEALGYLQLMAQQTARMQDLVDDLLTLARLEAGAPPQQGETVCPAGLVEQTLSAMQEQVQSKRLRLSTDLDRTLCLQAHSLDITSIVRNLIENAVKYTPVGERVHVVWRRQGEEAVFIVEDTGEGIPPEHLHRLTERFYRVDKGRSRASGGTGLGLSIVKHAAARYDGRLELESVPGRGSRFSVHFPVQRLGQA